MYWCFAGTKKVPVLSRWPYYRGDHIIEVNIWQGSTVFAICFAISPIMHPFDNYIIRPVSFDVNTHKNLNFRFPMATKSNTARNFFLRIFAITNVLLYFYCIPNIWNESLGKLCWYVFRILNASLLSFIIYWEYFESFDWLRANGEIVISAW